jgi:CheY-like chemotaxis protein
VVAVSMNDTGDRRNKMESVYLRLGNDVRQSLHNMMGLLELIGEDRLSDGQREYLLRCRRSADRLLLTVNDVSEIAESQPYVLQMAPLSLRNLVEETADLMSVLARRKGLRLTRTLGEGLPALVMGDRQLLEDLLRRLLENSIRYTNRGGIDLSVGLVDQASEADSGELTAEFTISDTGPGLPAEVLQYLQHPLSDPPLPGLGLMLVRTRLDAIGGSMGVLTSSAAGTAIAMRLPVSAASSVSGQLRNFQLPRMEHDPLNILIVEDSDDSYSLLVAFLQDTPHRIFRAHDGTFAVERVKTHRFDLILMDIMMPAMNGFEATAAIRRWESEEAREALPIILLSAEDPTRQKREGMAAGCSGFLMKPCRKQDVLQLVGGYWNATTVTGPSGIGKEEGVAHY